MLKAIEKMSRQLTKQMTGLCTEITSVKDIIIMHVAAADNNKQPLINDVEDMFAKTFPGFSWLQEGIP